MSGTNQLLMWAKLNAIKLNTESVLFTSKVAGAEAKTGKTRYMFMCLMSCTVYRTTAVRSVHLFSSRSTDCIERPAFVVSDTQIFLLDVLWEGLL
jgi:hypothetical protein